MTAIRGFALPLSGRIVPIPAVLLASWGLGTVASAGRAQVRLRPDHVRVSVQRAGAAVVSLLPALALGRSLLAARRCVNGSARRLVRGRPTPAPADSGRWRVLAGMPGLGVPTVLELVVSFTAAPGPARSCSAWRASRCWRCSSGV